MSQKYLSLHAAYSISSTPTFIMSSLPTFLFNSKVYTVDTVNQPALWRMRRATWYQKIHDVIILVRTGGTTLDTTDDIVDTEIFHLIFTLEEGWIKVDINTGKNILNML